MAKQDLNTSLPVCLFFFNRPNLVHKCLDSISKSSESFDINLYIFIDGPRNKEDNILIEETIEKINSFDFKNFKKISIKKNKENKGLASSIISGVDEVMKKYGKVIVIEDDLEVTNSFMPYMAAALKKYENQKDIGSISGFSFAIRADSNEDAYFHPRPNSWGWATWGDRWNSVNWEVDENYLNEIGYSKKSFNELGKDMDRMLQGYIKRKIDSWAIRWALHHWKSNWVALAPYKSRVINKGFGNEKATNTFIKNNFHVKLDTSNNNECFKFPASNYVMPRNLRIVNKYNSNMIRLFQRILPSPLWNFVSKKIYEYY